MSIDHIGMIVEAITIIVLVVVLSKRSAKLKAVQKELIKCFNQEGEQIHQQNQIAAIANGLAGVDTQMFTPYRNVTVVISNKDGETHPMVCLVMRVKGYFHAKYFSEQGNQESQSFPLDESGVRDVIRWCSMGMRHRLATSTRSLK